MAMYLAVPVIRNECNDSLSLELGATSSHALSLTAAKSGPFIRLNRDLYKRTLKE